MSVPTFSHCPATLAAGFSTYSRTGLKRVFSGRKVSHILPYESPEAETEDREVFRSAKQRFSFSGVQEKFSIVLDKNKLRLAEAGEQGTHILKPIPSFGKKADQIPANEHLTMQIARQVFGIETAENALVFFREGSPAFLSRRFDVQEEGGKLAMEDFASLMGRNPQTHGTDYKYQGSYLDLFQEIRRRLPAHQVESLRLFALLVFNYLFSNGDAHIRNFSIMETPMGDFRLSPAYDLLNTSIHIEDHPFALEDGLLPPSLAQGKVSRQFLVLAEEAGIPPAMASNILQSMCAKSEEVERMILASFLDAKTKRQYHQQYQSRWKKLDPIS